jgi:RimJ/RimL family protein N-acetyltransferase
MPTSAMPPITPPPGPAPGVPDAPPLAVAPVRTPWVPIRSLHSRHRARILAHLVALPAHDRYLRFGYAASDEQIGRYVEHLDFDRDEVFGVFNRRLELIALAHLAYPPAGAAHGQAAEFGGSVAAHARGRGYGGRLFEHAMLHARNRGLDTLFIHALSENTVMLRIARRAGGIVHRSGSESDAYVQLPHDTLASKLAQWVGDGAAEVDYHLKQQARVVDAVIDAIGEVKSGMAASAGGAARD